MRTLTKERVNSLGSLNSSGASSIDLITDGPNEVICRKLSNLQEDQKKAVVLAKQESMEKIWQFKKRNYAKMIISKYTKIFGISHEQMKDLVKELKDEDIVLLENAVLGRLKKPAIFQVIISFGALATFIGSSLGYFLFGNQILGGLAITMFSTATGWAFPLMFLKASFCGISDRCAGDVSPGNSFGSRRVLKNKYGPKYFPCRELKEELGISGL